KLHNNLNMKVTYHDPCHLGRHSGVYDAPRNVLKSIPGLELIEMQSTRNLAMCCGAGGGLKAAFNNLAIQIGVERVKAAKAVGAETLTSACPFCKHNLVDAIKMFNTNLEFYDLSEIVARAASKP
ncbi:MAG: heterodisulfide reductase-related iron-sulfur binding cluster, partial [Candidatus Bathyarchaeia archaeon]